VAKKNNFWARLQFRPTGDSVSLDDVDVAPERFGHRENREWLVSLGLDTLADRNSAGAEPENFFI
jgi:hypothetical protein